MIGLTAPAATAAHLMVPDNRQFTRNQIFNHGPYLGPCPIMINIDARLPESHQRSHTDASDNQGIHPMLGQDVYGHHASALNVALILYRCHLFDFTVFNIYKGEYVTVAEMP